MNGPRPESELAELIANQLAAELHDGPVPWMVGAKMQAEALRRQAAAGERLDVAKLDVLIDTIRQALVQSRRLMQGLQGPELGPDNWQSVLQADLQQACQAFEAPRPRLEFEFADQTQTLAEPLAIVAYRVIREAVWNALKHAQANGIVVRVGRHDNHLQIAIDDDGRGFVPDAIGSDRYGLAGIRQRAAEVGGQAVLNSAPQQGTEWRITLPIDP